MIIRSMLYVHFTFLGSSVSHEIQANAGDSRSVIGIKGEVKPLSFDHKPTSDSEDCVPIVRA